MRYRSGHADYILTLTVRERTLRPSGFPAENRSGRGTGPPLLLSGTETDWFPLRNDSTRCLTLHRVFSSPQWPISSWCARSRLTTIDSGITNLRLYLSFLYTSSSTNSNLLFVSYSNCLLNSLIPGSVSWRNSSSRSNGNAFTYATSRLNASTCFIFSPGRCFILKRYLWRDKQDVFKHGQILIDRRCRDQNVVHIDYDLVIPYQRTQYLQKTFLELRRRFGVTERHNPRAVR